MADNLFRGRMAFVGHIPWHRLGEAVASTVTAKEMCKAAGLDWKVTKEPAPGARIVNRRRGLHDRYLTMRDPAGEETDAAALGMVGSGYEPLQNTEAFKFSKPFIEGKYAQFHTAGAHGNGERVWVLVKLNDQIVIQGDDIVDRFLLLSNSHDESGAVPIRVVCQNTLNFAIRRGSGAISVRHTRNVAQHLATAQATELKRVIDKAFKEAGTVFSNMALKALTTEHTDTILEILFPRTDRQKKDGLDPERWCRIKHTLDDEAVTPFRTKNTLWALYNAITRDEDYRSSRSASAGASRTRLVR